MGGNIDGQHFTTEIFGDDFMAEQLVTDTLRSARFVTFVDGDNHRAFSGTGVVDRLDRLLHDTTSAATTRMTISVIFAPRMRISVKAS